MPNIQLFGSIPMRSLPLIEENLDPARHGYGPDVAGFALPVDDGLEQIQFLLGHVSIQTTERYLGVVFPLLYVAEIQSHRLVPPKAASEQDRQERPVTFAFQKLTVGRVPEPLGLFWR
jgi:hypothetical protein